MPNKVAFTINNKERERVQVTLAEQDGKVIATFMKQILKRGEFAHPQFPDTMIDYNDDFFQQIIDAFNAGVITNVNVINGTHDESDLEKVIGRVVELSIKPKGLFSTMEIADEDIIDGIETKLSDGKGLIDEVSVSLNSTFTDDGEFIPLALFHVAIVAHGFYRDMASFERIAASLAGTNKTFNGLNAEDLGKRIQRVRSAFYRQLIFGNLWPEEVHDDFVIATSNDDSVLVQVSYTQEDNQITFGEANVVEQTYKVISKLSGGNTLSDNQDSINDEQVLEHLKASGIDFESLESLRDSISKGKGATQIVKDVVNATGLSKQVKSGEVTLDGLYTSIAGLVDSNKTLIASVQKISDENDELKSLNAKAEASHAIDALITAGKVVPAKKDDFIKLYQSDKELFDSLTADLEVKVNTDEEGHNGGGSEGKVNGEFTDEEVDKKAKELFAEHVSVNGTGKGKKE